MTRVVMQVAKETKARLLTDWPQSYTKGWDGLRLKNEHGARRYFAARNPKIFKRLWVWGVVHSPCIVCLRSPQSHFDYTDNEVCQRKKCNNILHVNYTPYHQEITIEYSEYHYNDRNSAHFLKLLWMSSSCPTEYRTTTSTSLQHSIIKIRFFFTSL